MLAPESILIRFFLTNRENYNKYSYIISSIVLEKELHILFKTLDKYYETIDHHNYVGKDEFVSFFLLHNGVLKEKEIILDIINNIYVLDISDSLILEVIKNIVERDTANKIVNKLLPILSENKFGVLASIEEDLVKYTELIKKHGEDESPFNEKGLDELLESNITGGGLQWRLECLQRDLGVLRPGILGHIFARVETGKSSFLSSELSHMAGQLEDDETIIWFCNEESTDRLKLRLYSSICNSSIQDVLLNKDKAMAIFNQRGGNKIKLVGEATQFSVIRNMCFEYKPRLVVVDSGDVVSFPGSKDMGEVLKLKELYIKYRNLAMEFSTAVLTVGQANAEAAGKKWLEMHHMDNSKTGKPASLDFAIGIGKLMDESEEGIRYLNLPKNKLSGIHSRHTTRFDQIKARYADL